MYLLYSNRNHDILSPKALSAPHYLTSKYYINDLSELENNEKVLNTHLRFLISVA